VLNLAFRSCKVRSRGIEGVGHTVEVAAESFYEAVALGLTTFRDADCVRKRGHGQTTVTIVVKQIEVEHKMRIRDFEAWLESMGRAAAGMILKSRLRQLLGK
jgi:hypothetical protein